MKHLIYVFPDKFAFYQVTFPAKGAFSLANWKMRDEMERKVASLSKIICAHLTSVDSDICILFMTSICVNSKMRDEVHRQVHSLG